MLETIGQADHCIAVWSQRVNKPAKDPLMRAPLSPDLLEKMDAYWRAANLTFGQIYLQDNPLLETTLKIEHIKPRPRSPRWTTVGECSAKFERVIQRTLRHAL